MLQIVTSWVFLVVRIEERVYLGPSIVLVGYLVACFFLVGEASNPFFPADSCKFRGIRVHIRKFRCGVFGFGVAPSRMHQLHILA